MAGNGQMSVSQALDLVRDVEVSQADPTAVAILDAFLTALWARIQANQNYVMSSEEFAVFNFYRTRFGNSEVARLAVGRYWSSTHGNGSGADGSG